MIITGTIIAHSLRVFPKNVGFSGDRKSQQKYPAIATIAAAKIRTPKDLSLNLFHASNYAKLPYPLKTFEKKKRKS
jgi:hypothetical protein